MADEPELTQIVIRLVQMVSPARPESVSLDDLLVRDLGFHSLAMVELAFAIEDLFRIEDIPVEQVAGIKSVRDIAPIVTSALDQGSAEIPSSAALADFAVEYGFAWEVSDGERQGSW